MVAKILRSTSFLMTRAVFTPSFSDSSLTVMPSPIVISLLIDRQRLRLEARLGRAKLALGIALAIFNADRGAAFALKSPLRFRRNRLSGFRTKRRGRVHRTASGTTHRATAHRTAARTARTVRAADHRTARPAGPRPKIGWPGLGDGGPLLRHPRSRDATGGTGRGPGLLNTRDKVGTRRNDGPRGRLSGQRTLGPPGRRCWRRHRGARTGHGRRTGSAEVACGAPGGRGAGTPGASGMIWLPSGVRPSPAPAAATAAGDRRTPGPADTAAHRGQGSRGFAERPELPGLLAAVRRLGNPGPAARGCGCAGAWGAAGCDGAAGAGLRPEARPQPEPHFLTEAAGCETRLALTAASPACRQRADESARGRQRRPQRRRRDAPHGRRQRHPPSS